MFYYTNFIAETNSWWLRRVRPIWVAGVCIWAYWLFHRYYFFGRWAVKNQREVSDTENRRRAAHNLHDFGFPKPFKPTLERSRKHQIMALLGDQYDYSIPFENRMLQIETFEQLQEKIDSENDY
jgi:hypothetical protein